VSLWRDVRRANWRDPGQWRHAFHFVGCRLVFGRSCPHIIPGQSFWSMR
jgi:hypothetical protein